MIRRNLPRASSGFTLIELMVVITIIAIIAGFATLSVGQSPGRIVQDEAHRLRSLLGLAGEEAVMQSEELAVEIFSNGYRFLSLNQSDQKWQWQVISDNPLYRARCFPQDIALEAEIEGAEAPLEKMDCAAETLRAQPKAAEKEQAAAPEPQSDADKEEKIPPRVFLLSSGEMTPFEFTLTLPDKSNAQHLSGELTGKLDVRSPDDKKKS